MNYNVTLIFFLFQVQILFSQRIPSYYKDIAPIINSNCVECHQNGGLGPFPLTNYEEVRSKIKMIINVTQSVYMPPWQADPEFRSFKN